MKNAAYLLGHSDFELQRLSRQGQVLGPTTREWFQTAGMAPGMCVLDVGSGMGDVAFLAADLVGPSGEVVGTDVAPAAIAAREPQRLGGAWHRGERAAPSGSR